MVAWKGIVMLLAGFKQWYERIELANYVGEFSICLMRGEVIVEGKGIVHGEDGIDERWGTYTEGPRPRFILVQRPAKPALYASILIVLASEPYLPSPLLSNCTTSALHAWSEQ